MVNKLNEVHLLKLDGYQADEIYDALPQELFTIITPGDTVVLKPNWVLEEHQYHQGEWEQVITHPAVVTAVLRRVVDSLGNNGKIIITDGPELNADFDKIISYQNVENWKAITDFHNIALQIIDLRDELYIQDKNVTVRKVKLQGDPLGKIVADLREENSEFFGHIKSQKGYFGGGSDIKEANISHDGHTNLYSVSRSVIEADVFVNIPKLKTHKKAGITCSLKNLVGINTYRNYLPHNSVGTPDEGGDQFPSSKSKSRIESALMPFIHQHILNKHLFAKLFSPVIGLGKMVFGDNKETIRGGSWYGNDTLWRMILDINKVLFYLNPDGTFTNGFSLKKGKYISIVDSIVAGDGDGPKAPDKVSAGYIIAGTNPVSVDAVCARLMNFDCKKIPSIENALRIKYFPIAGCKKEDIEILYKGEKFSLSTFPSFLSVSFKPHRGWVGHIELKQL